MKSGTDPLTIHSACHNPQLILTTAMTRAKLEP